MDKQKETTVFENSPVHSQLLQWWTVFIKHRIRLFFWLLAGLALGLIIFFISPRKFQAEATIITTSSSNPTSSLLSQAQMFTGLSLGQGEIAQIFPKVSESRLILTKVLDRSFRDKTVRDAFVGYFELGRDLEGVQLDSQILDGLRQAINVSYKIQESLVSIKVTLEDAELAAVVANSIVHELGRFMDTMKEDEVKLQGQVLGRRLVDVADSLQASEATLLEFRLRNRDFSKSPSLLMREGRLRRDVELYSQVFSELSRQNEILQIQKLSGSAKFTILDLAIVAERPFSPKLLRLVIYFIVLGLVCGIIDLQFFLWGEEKRFKPLVSLILGKR